jgi:hypothetical protein
LREDTAHRYSRAAAPQLSLCTFFGVAIDIWIDMCLALDLYGGISEQLLAWQ